jgi:RHS repeat-associated protein
MELTYYTSGGSGDAGDQYTGLDRFGRVVDQRWELNGVDLERLKYGYDQASNQVWRQNTVALTGQDQYYTDDGLYQLKTLQRGTLNATQTGISGTPSWEEDWNYDPLGNWNGSASAYQTRVAGTTTLNQNRTHSTVNEITNITESAGPAWPTPGYDAAGNMTSGPQPLSPANGYVLTYDAWNQLVEVKNGNVVVADYAYDGASRRTTKTGSATRHYYYDDQWRVAEERLDTTTTADRRFVWGIRRLDDLILRDRASTRLYALDDKINVTAVVDTTGTVQERYGYNGFGGVNYMNTNFGSIPASAFDWETLFDSYRYDTESGFYQVRYRYLHPLLGRWLTRDPINELGFQVLRTSTFISQVGNQPIGWPNHDSIGEPGFELVANRLENRAKVLEAVHFQNGSAGLLAANPALAMRVQKRFAQLGVSFNTEVNPGIGSPYMFVQNDPISKIDPSGLREFWIYQAYLDCPCRIRMAAVVAVTYGLVSEQAAQRCRVATQTFFCQAIMLPLANYASELVEANAFFAGCMITNSIK